MKKILIPIIAGVFTCMEAYSQQRSVDFRTIGFEEALTNAKAENKNIFMDCYTSWCGPCKAMARDVFTVDSIADYFNSTFVCIKYDMEKEGKELAKKYPLSCYPTFLILDAEGKELHRLSGYYSPDKLMKAIRMAKPENSLGHLEEKFNSGERSPEFMEAYLTVLKGQSKYEQIDDILSSLSLYRSDKDINNQTIWYILQEFQTTTGTPDVHFLLAHLPQFRHSVGTEAVDKLLDKLYSIEVASYIFWEQKTPGQPFNPEQFNRFITNLQQLEFNNQATTLALALTEKMYREKQYGEAIHYIRKARELCIMPKEHQLSYFSLYVNKLCTSTEQFADLKALREECDQMLDYTPGNLLILKEKYRICHKLRDNVEIPQLKAELEKAGEKAGFEMIYEADGQINMKKL